MSDSGISWAICKSAPRSRQITMPVPHHSVFYRPDALPATQPTVSKHWRHCSRINAVKTEKLFTSTNPQLWHFRSEKQTSKWILCKHIITAECITECLPQCLADTGDERQPLDELSVDNVAVHVFNDDMLGDDETGHRKNAETCSDCTM